MKLKPPPDIAPPVATAATSGNLLKSAEIFSLNSAVIQNVSVLTFPNSKGFNVNL